MFIPNGQLVAVGVQPAPDGDGVFAVLKIEHCVDSVQAQWIADQVAADLCVFLDADPAEEVVLKHCYPEPGGTGWTAAIGVELEDQADAEACVGVLAAYANPGPDGALN